MKPKSGKPVTIYLPLIIAAALKEAAQQGNTSQAAIVARALKKELKLK